MNLHSGTFLFCTTQQMGDWAPNGKDKYSNGCFQSDSLRTRSLSTVLHCPLECFSHPKGCKRDQLDPLWAFVEFLRFGFIFFFPSSFRGQLHRTIRVITSLPKTQRGTRAWVCLTPLLRPSLSSHPLPYSWSDLRYHPSLRTQPPLRLGPPHATGGRAHLQCLLF